jgi:hypothetical protein
MTPIARAAFWADVADLVWQFVGRKNDPTQTRAGIAAVLASRLRAGVPEADLREARRIAELMIADIYADQSEMEMRA